MKIGDYVRTKDGYISKIKELGINVYTDVGTWSEGYVIKSSPNIIDLIEENDYINGLRVNKNKYGELYTSYVYYGGDIGKQCEVYTTWLKEYTEDMIYEIATKESFKNISYKVGE